MSRTSLMLTLAVVCSVWLVMSTAARPLDQLADQVLDTGDLAVQQDDQPDDGYVNMSRREPAIYRNILCNTACYLQGRMKGGYCEWVDKIIPSNACKSGFVCKCIQY